MYLASALIDAKCEKAAACAEAFASLRSMACLIRPALGPSSWALHSMANAHERSESTSGNWRCLKQQQFLKCSVDFRE